MVRLALRTFQITKWNIQNIISLQILWLVTLGKAQRDLILDALHIFRGALEEAIAVDWVFHDVEVFQVFELLERSVADFLKIVLEEVEAGELFEVERHEGIIGDAGDLVLSERQFFEIRESRKGKLGQSIDAV